MEWPGYSRRRPRAEEIRELRGALAVCVYTFMILLQSGTRSRARWYTEPVYGEQGKGVKAGELLHPPQMITRGRLLLEDNRGAERAPTPGLRCGEGLAVG